MDTLELPTGGTVHEGDLLLYGGYPYRFRPLPDDDEYAFELAPLYWGEGGMDVPFRDREALVDQWDADSRGVLSPSEWDRWLAAAREDDRFDDAELDALAAELPGDAGPEGDANDGGALAWLRRLLGG